MFAQAVDESELTRWSQLCTIRHDRPAADCGGKTPENQKTASLYPFA